VDLARGASLWFERPTWFVVFGSVCKFVFDWVSTLSTSAGICALLCCCAVAAVLRQRNSPVRGIAAHRAFCFCLVLLQPEEMATEALDVAMSALSSGKPEDEKNAGQTIKKVRRKVA
jgi:hypothetical protein